MVGGIANLKNRTAFERYKKILKQIILEIKIVENRVALCDKAEKWTTNCLSIVKAEINELYGYAQEGKVVFKYGKSQKMLESTYCITDSIGTLNSTNLGQYILELQKVYNRF